MPRRGIPLPPDTKTRDYYTIDGVVYCYKSLNSRCHGSNLVVPNKLSSFHDAELRQLTKKINALLARVKKKSGHELCTLLTPKGPFLAWTRHDDDAVSSFDKENKINKALGLN